MPQTPERKKEYMKEYNAELVKKGYYRDRYKRLVDHIKELEKKRYQKNRKKIRARRALRYKENKGLDKTK